MSFLSKTYFILWLLFGIVNLVEADEPPPLVADADLVGNVDGTVADAATGKPIAGAIVTLLETPLQSAAENSPDAFNSTNGWFIRPMTTGSKLQAMTDGAGEFLINSVPTPFPYKLYTIIVEGAGYDLFMINQAQVLPGAVMTLKVTAALTKATGLATVYFGDEEHVPMIHRHEELVLTQAEIVGTIPLDGLQGRIFATREGLVGRTTANGHKIVTRDRFVALPSRRALCTNGGYQYQVRVSYNGRTVTAPVWDVGPWNIKDDYWNPSSQRQMFQDLPQGKPEAQAAYLEGYNGGKDDRGRRVANPAGIDLADGTFWDDLKLGTNSWINVEYLWVESGCSCIGTAPTLACVIKAGQTFSCKAAAITLQPGFHAQPGSVVTLGQ